MHRVTEVIARLKEQVAALRSVQGAFELKKIIEGKGAPPMGPACFVVPAGLIGGDITTMSEATVQDYAAAVTVLVMFRAVQGTGGDDIDDVDDVITAICEAIVGWAPDGTVGDFSLVDGKVADFERGTLIYATTFQLPLQLRIS